MCLRFFIRFFIDGTPCHLGYMCHAGGRFLCPDDAAVPPDVGGVRVYLTAMADEHAAYVILGIENQDEVHYAMPVKNMVYDALEYAGQVRKAASSHRNAKDAKEHSAGEYLSGVYKEDRLVPVITLVVFFSAGEWDGPMSLHEMLNVQDEEI